MKSCYLFDQPLVTQRLYSDTAVGAQDLRVCWELASASSQPHRFIRRRQMRGFHMPATSIILLRETLEQRVNMDQDLG
jgi:hypothetical protein